MSVAFNIKYPRKVGWTDEARAASLAARRSQAQENKPKELPSHLAHIPDAIARAVDAQPDRAGHGSVRGGTGVTGFWVKPDGSVIQYNKLQPAEAKDAINVHSHSSSEPDQNVIEDFQPANAGDLHADIVNSQRAGGPVPASVVIMADGRMEIMDYRSGKVDPKFYTLSMKKLENELHPSRDEREQYYNAHKNDPDYHAYNQEREMLRAFSQKYGIVYHENLRWKPISKSGTFKPNTGLIYEARKGFVIPVSVQINQRLGHWIYSFSWNRNGNHKKPKVNVTLKYSEDQPRDDRGRWSGGGTAVADKPIVHEPNRPGFEPGTTVHEYPKGAWTADSFRTDVEQSDSDVDYVYFLFHEDGTVLDGYVTHAAMVEFSGKPSRWEDVAVHGVATRYDDGTIGYSLISRSGHTGGKEHEDAVWSQFVGMLSERGGNPKDRISFGDGSPSISLGELTGKTPKEIQEIRLKYSENQPRDERGRWSGGGGAVQWITPTPEKFVEARDQTNRPEFLSPLKPEELSDYQLFLSPDGKTGFGIDPQGDAQNLFNNPGGVKGAGTRAAFDAIDHGGKTLDCIDIYLPSLYAQAGFVETGRMKFSDALAPKTWDYVKLDRPDVVFMAWKGWPDGSRQASLERALDRGRWSGYDRTERYYESYDQAKADSRRVATSKGHGARTWSSADGAGRELGHRPGAVHGRPLTKVGWTDEARDAALAARRARAEDKPEKPSSESARNALEQEFSHRESIPNDPTWRDANYEMQQRLTDDARTQLAQNTSAWDAGTSHDLGRDLVWAADKEDSPFRGQYEYTQEALKQIVGDSPTIDVYRGFGGKGPGEGGGEAYGGREFLDTQRAAGKNEFDISDHSSGTSWTTSYDVARFFAGDESHIIMATVPVKNVLSMWMSNPYWNPASIPEHEVVVRHDAPIHARFIGAGKGKSFIAKDDIDSYVLDEDTEMTFGQMREAFDEENSKAKLLALWKYSEDQPRDEHGRWTSGGVEPSVAVQGSLLPEVAIEIKERQQMLGNLAEKAGFDRDAIVYVHENGPQFQVGNYYYTEGGHFDPKMNMIMIYRTAFETTPGSLERLVTHEVEHAKFDLVQKEAKNEITGAIKEDGEVRGAHGVGWHDTDRGGGPYGGYLSPLDAGGLLRPEAESKYPVAAGWAKLIESKLSSSKEPNLRDEDGVSSYSASYWEAFEKGEQFPRGIYTPVNETFAEYASARVVASRVELSALAKDKPAVAMAVKFIDDTYKKAKA